MAADREQLGAERQEVEARATQARAELAALRSEASELQRQLPEIELQAQAMADHLAQVRAQLREHITRPTVTRSRAAKSWKLCTQVSGRGGAHPPGGNGLAQSPRRPPAGCRLIPPAADRVARPGHRHEAIFARGETRLERHQAEVDEQARQVDVTSARLARQVEELQEQERMVATRQNEMERHLEDMREWYRRKLRELAAGGSASAGNQKPT